MLRVVLRWNRAPSPKTPSGHILPVTGFHLQMGKPKAQAQNSGKKLDVVSLPVSCQLLSWASQDSSFYTLEKVKSPVFYTSTGPVMPQEAARSPARAAEARQCCHWKCEPVAIFMKECSQGDLNVSWEPTVCHRFYLSHMNAPLQTAKHCLLCATSAALQERHSSLKYVLLSWKDRNNSTPRNPKCTGYTWPWENPPAQSLNVFWVNVFCTKKPSTVCPFSSASEQDPDPDNMCCWDWRHLPVWLQHLHHQCPSLSKYCWSESLPRADPWAVVCHWKSAGCCCWGTQSRDVFSLCVIHILRTLLSKAALEQDLVS